MTTIATICARGGSKGVPGKNTRTLLGRPLIAYSIDQALNTPGIDGVYVSTDSQSIADVAVANGATVLGLRPPELAEDSSPKIPVIEHLVSTVEERVGRVDTVIDLQPTSPLRLIADIEGAMARLTDGIDLVITGAVAEANPYYSMVEADPSGDVHLVKQPSSSIGGRQAAPQVFSMNGSIYCWRRDSLSNGMWSGRVVLFEMPRERSVDVDEEIDWQILELVARSTGVLEEFGGVQG